MRKTKEETERSRLRILDAAEEVFCSQGYGTAKMNDIAHRAGLTKGAIFWHFENKAALFREVHTRAVARIQQQFEAIFSGSEPVMEKCRKVLIQIRRERAFEVLMAFGSFETDRVPREMLVELHSSIAAILDLALKKLEAAKRQGELLPETDLFDIISPFVLVMSGFGKMSEVKRILGGLAERIDGDVAITMLFRGLDSLQGNK
jgi:AcrR family transcriptional regulator